MPSIKDRQDRIEQLYRQAVKEGLDKDPSLLKYEYGIISRIQSWAQRDYLVSQQVARDYARVVLGKLQDNSAEDPSSRTPKPVGSSASG